MTFITPSQWDSLFKDWEIPKKHQKKLIKALNELYKLQYEKDLKLLKADVEYWKSKSKVKQQLSKHTIDNPALSKEAMRMKTQLIEDMLHQISTFEQEQVSWKEYVDSFVNKHSLSLSEVYENFKTYSRQMNGNISVFRKEIEEKVREYSSIEKEIKDTLSEMKSSIAASGDMIAMQNKRIEDLEAENLALHKKIDEISKEAANWNSIKDKEIKKWKDISLLTIPLVEMVSKTLSKSNALYSIPLPTVDTLNNVHRNSFFNENAHSKIGDAEKSIVHFEKSESKKQTSHLKLEVSERIPTNEEAESQYPVKVSISFVDSASDNQNNIEITHPRDAMSTPKLMKVQLSDTVDEDNHILDQSLNLGSIATNSMEFHNLKHIQEIQNGHVVNNSSDLSTNTSQLGILQAPPSIHFLKCRRMVHHQIGYNTSRQPDHVDGFAKRARFFHPVAIALQSNTCIIAEAGNHCLRKLNLQDNLVSTVTSPLVGNSKKVLPKLDCPGGLCFNPSNSQQVYVTDLNERKIFSVDIQKGALFPIKMKSPSMSSISAEIPFNNPYDCTVDEDGSSLYVSHDMGIAIIRLKSRDCSFIGSTKKCGYQDGTLQNSLFDHPNGISFIDKDIFVVCDTGNHVLRLINLSTGIVNTISGKQGFPCIRDGPLSEACFSAPRKICSLTGSSAQYLFVTEDNSHIRMIDLTNQTVQSIEMKPALDSPFGISAKFGNHENQIHIYVADCHSHVVVHTELNLFSDVVESYSNSREYIQSEGSIHNEVDSEFGDVPDNF